MSSIKIGEPASKEDIVSTPVFTTVEPKQEKKADKKVVVATRGPNLTPKSDMHVGRDWTHLQWEQAFKAYSKKLERLNYNSKKNAQ